MSIYQSGIDLTGACMLIAMHDMFNDGVFDVTEGMEFLQELFIEAGGKSFPSKYNYLIEEALPVIKFPVVYFTVYYHQTMRYVHIYDRVNNIRYRVLRDEPITVAYLIDSYNENGERMGHAVTMPAHMFNLFMSGIIEKFAYLFLRKNGILIDTISYEYDVERGVVIE